MSNPFRHPVNNVMLLRALFFETSDGADKTLVVYTLKDEDHLGFPSLYRLYMEMDDLTEYEFANTYLDGWAHWKKLKECTWFKEYAERWYEELTLRHQAQALRAVKAEAAEGRNKYNANKYLLEKGWEDKPNSKAHVGRPTKEKIKQEAEKLSLEHQEILEDSKRVVN